MHPTRRWAALALALTLVGCSLIGSEATPPATSASATPTAHSDAVTASPAPSGSPSATPTATPTATPAVSPTASPTASPSPVALPTPRQVDANWNLERVADRGYGNLSLVIDSAGFAHFVATDQQGIVYRTNAGGHWTRERIGTPADGSESDRNATIAIDGTGQLVVAYERSSCSMLGCRGAEIYVTVKKTSGWSLPDLVAVGISPHLAANSNVVGVAYTAVDGVDDMVCDEQPTPIDFAASTEAGWLIERVAADGERPWLAMAPGGSPHILVDNLCGTLGQAGLYLATPTEPAGSFALEAVPGTEEGNSAGFAIVVDGNGRRYVMYSRYVDNVGDQYVYVVETDGSWSSPFEIVAGRPARWMAADQGGHVHVLAQDDGGLWHATDTSGAWTLDQPSEKPGNEAALALDAAGRPHVLFVTGDYSGGPSALWYAILTAP